MEVVRHCDDIKGFTVDGSPGFDLLPGVSADQARKYYAITIKPQVFINMVPDHIIFHRMYPVAADRTIVECDWLYAPSVVESGADLTASVELFHRVNSQDFEACEQTTVNEKVGVIVGNPPFASKLNTDGAKRAYDRTPTNADSIIWYARRRGYLGRIRESIA